MNKWIKAVTEVDLMILICFVYAEFLQKCTLMHFNAPMQLGIFQPGSSLGDKLLWFLLPDVGLLEMLHSISGMFTPKILPLDFTSLKKNISTESKSVSTEGNMFISIFIQLHQVKPSRAAAWIFKYAEDNFQWFWSATSCSTVCLSTPEVLKNSSWSGALVCTMDGSMRLQNVPNLGVKMFVEWLWLMRSS